MVFELLIGALSLYAALLVAAVLLHRRMLYVLDPVHVKPEDAGLAGVEEIRIAAPDGAVVLGWHGKARPGQPTLLYFHGNGGSLLDRKPRIERFMAEGWGVLVMTYRGYGGSSGSPSETNNIADGIRAHDWLTASGVRASDIVLYGESLGTGVATRVALERRAAGLVLDAPFTSIPDVARRRFKLIPLKWIPIDRYCTERIIDRIAMPLLILHGELDAVVPVAMGRKLFALAREPKTLAVLPRGGHSDLYIDGNDALTLLKAFIARLKR